MLEYQPRPIDTSKVVLPAELLALTERLAEHTHDVWALGRMAEGWRYGPRRDDAKREHPGLVAYSELSEGEKEYDRRTAIEALRAIVAMGYGIGRRDGRGRIAGAEEPSPLPSPEYRRGGEEPPPRPSPGVPVEGVEGGKPFALSVKAVVRDGRGRCLLLRRSMESKNNAGMWDFPGGKLDPGEDFAVALVREVREETGLGVVMRGLVGSAESESPRARVVYLVMDAVVGAGPSEVRLSSEHSESAWVEAREIGKMEVCPQFRGIVGRL